MAIWKYKIDIKQHLDKDGASAQQAAKGILKEIARISTKKAFEDDCELSQITEEFQGIVDDPKSTDKEFDEILERFYDWADSNRVWCGL